MLDVLIIGAGPHALTLASLLRHPNFSNSANDSHILDGIFLSKTRMKNGKSRTKGKNEMTKLIEQADNLLKQVDTPESPPLSVKVVDPYGEWVTLWQKQFNALRIPHLRSHTLVHTDPFNKKALQEFAVKHERTEELHSLPEHIYIQDENAFFNDSRLGKKEKKKLSASGALKQSLYFSLPSSGLVMDFFQQQIHRYHLESILIKGTVERIIPILAVHNDQIPSKNERKSVQHFNIVLQNGDVIAARQVVLATGPTRIQMANIPSWVKSIHESYPEERLQHTVQLIHYQDGKQVSASVCNSGERVLVVGGGLTSAHIILFAFQQGARHVHWVLRKHLQLKQFDVGDIETLVGRYSHVEHGIKLDGLAYLRQFYNERSLHKRLAMIRQARKGGAVTPEAYKQMQEFIISGDLMIKTYSQVSEAKWSYKDQEWKILLSTGESLNIDRIWLATGCKLDVSQDPLLTDITEEFPIQVLDGWPCLSENLQWAPGCNFYLMGQYAALQIGPHAVNLAGGQAASARIAKAIFNKYRDLDDCQPFEKGETEEYLLQMHGLMWL
ncbi:uncharacterized protein zgc:113276 isoform X1 [Polypterus senegalus]|uniref:uncharacterized protein zgc:113276 isoform X1 n=1 Tax=Polypterus senegalus TaxID=55291 RepID=UPI0019637C89|nr:uncharacterized protein zgc:113276 isoform X1 [Polypterus senegalus]